MHRDEFRKIVADNVRQTMTERSPGSALTADQEALVQAIADGVFAGLETAFDEATEMSAAAAVAAAAVRQPQAAGALPGATAPATVPTQAGSGSPEATAAAGSVPGAGTREEVLIWRGRPYLTIGTIYELTSQRLRVLRGIVSNAIEEVELVRVRDTAVKQNVGERMFDIGDITIMSSDETSPVKVLFNVRNPVEVREMIRKAVYEERERRRMLYREDMHEHHASDMDQDPTY